MVVALIPMLVAVALAALERVPAVRYRPSRMFRRFFASDVVYLLTGFVAGGSAALSFIGVGSDLIGSTFGVPRVSTRDLPLWVTAPAALVALDLGNYVAHSLLHRYAVLWEFHKVHHSIEALDWLATFRSHIVEQTLRRLMAPLLLILVGFPTDAVALAGGLFLAWAIMNHANLDLKLRLLEPLFVTPRLHRIHHVPDTDDRNFGTVLTIWDRLRGTLLVRDTSPNVAFGVAGEVTTYPGGWLAQLVEPFKRILGRTGASEAHVVSALAGSRAIAIEGLRTASERVPEPPDAKRGGDDDCEAGTPHQLRRLVEHVRVLSGVEERDRVERGQ
jgi:sterol desaturase/sphingolipid hydroxylase (fatty acid hydroxylase superfamily)